MARKYPFTSANQLCDDFDVEDRMECLPGHPLARLDAVAKLGNFIESELCCEDLEVMAPHLWMMSTQSSSNIQPLHRHKLLGREIFITESPRLHLVWYYNRVFIKPLPKYLGSYAFWSTYLLDESPALGSRTQHIRRAALGYLRTYLHLVKHESDFDLAQTYKLLPGGITWPQFCAFVSRFDSIADSDVSGRYNFGEIRLTRLNFYCMFILGRFYFEHLPMQYGDYFSRYLGPLLFAFAVVSTLLSAMQVELGVPSTAGSGLESVWAVYRWFSVVVILAGLGISIILACYFVYMVAGEWWVALTVRRKRKVAKMQERQG